MGSFLIESFECHEDYLLFEKSQGVCKILSFLEISEHDSLQICDGYLRGIGLLNFQGFYEKSTYSIFSLIKLSGSGRGLNNCQWFLRVEIIEGMLDSGVARWIEF